MLVLAVSWFAVRQTRYGIETTSLLLVPDANGEYALSDASDSFRRYEAWRADESIPFDCFELTLRRDTRWEGNWAPVRCIEELGVSAKLLQEGERPGAYVSMADLMPAVPPEKRGRWGELWVRETGRAPVTERAVWWGYLWNGATLAAIVGAAASLVTMPFWFLERRTERIAKRRRARGLCARCGYQVRTGAGALATCPECGLKSTA